MKFASDAIVVGGGPVGAFTAWNLSKLGVSTTIFEEHSEVGVPSHCAGHLSIHGLRALGLEYLRKGIVENIYSGANFYSAKGTRFSVRLRKPVTCSVNRVLFDKFLIEKAIETGAVVSLNSRVTSTVVKDGYVVGVNVEQRNRGEKLYNAKVVVDCEGVSSRLLKQTYPGAIKRRELVYGIEAEVENVENVIDDEVGVYLGNDYAPGFYAWLMPRRDGSAKVGLATATGNPKELFLRFCSKHPAASKQLSRAKVRRMAFHSISLGGPLSRTYSDGFLVVGDAASQVKPTTGGGVILGMICAKMAAEVVAEAKKTNDFSSASLQRYQSRCNKRMGFDFRAMLRAREFICSLSDKKMDSALEFCRRFKLGDALRDVNEIDLQGQALLRIGDKPALYAAIAYFLLLCLTANP